MSTTTKPPEINTTKPIENDGIPRQPHERDETPDRQSIEPREIIKQAARDLRRGLVDTDLHGERGVEKVVQPDPSAKDADSHDKRH